MYSQSCIGLQEDLQHCAVFSIPHNDKIITFHFIGNRVPSPHQVYEVAVASPLLFQFFGLVPLQLPVGETLASCFTKVVPAAAAAAEDEEELAGLVGGWLRSPASVGGVGKLSAAVPPSCCW